MPRSTMAIAIAAAWASFQPSPARPSTKAWICSAESAPPSRLIAMICCASMFVTVADSASVQPGDAVQRPRRQRRVVLDEQFERVDVHHAGAPVVAVLQRQEVVAAAGHEGVDGDAQAGSRVDRLAVE